MGVEEAGSYGDLWACLLHLRACLILEGRGLAAKWAWPLPALSWFVDLLDGSWIVVDLLDDY